MSKKTYSHELLMELKAKLAGAPAPAGFQPPKEVSVDHVVRPVVKKKERRTEQSDDDDWRKGSTPNEAPETVDFLGPEERAKLEEIQRLVRQQKPLIKINFREPIETNASDLNVKWVAKGHSPKSAGSPPPSLRMRPAAEKTDESVYYVLNPNADPFVSKFGESDAEKSDSSDETEDSDPPWGSDVELPPPPTGSKAKKIETDVWRLKQRQKQIRIGLQTVGYKNFLRARELGVEVDAETPRKPNVYQVCSKRAWDGQIRRWRQLLHKYDDLTDSLWSEEEAREVHAIGEKHKKFKEKVRRQHKQDVDMMLLHELGEMGGIPPGMMSFGFGPDFVPPEAMMMEHGWVPSAVPVSRPPADGEEADASPGADTPEPAEQAESAPTAASKLSSAASPFLPKGAEAAEAAPVVTQE